MENQPMDHARMKAHFELFRPHHPAQRDYLYNELLQPRRDFGRDYRRSFASLREQAQSKYWAGAQLGFRIPDVQQHVAGEFLADYRWKLEQHKKGCILTAIFEIAALETRRIPELASTFARDPPIVTFLKVEIILLGTLALGSRLATPIGSVVLQPKALGFGETAPIEGSFAAEWCHDNRSKISYESMIAYFKRLGSIWGEWDGLEWDPLLS